ncbi:MAG: DUF1146 family protein [Limosilactobacillus sp.]|nr:DUF1146 family protein [Limosilactobacillus sp.]MCI2031625.1 DUF1146 family protein [Limosilactobacillus sp.]
MQLSSVKALVEIVIQLGMIWLTFTAIQGIHFERMFRQPPKTLPLIIVLFSTAIGYLCASFFIGFINAVSQLPGLLR